MSPKLITVRHEREPSVFGLVLFVLLGWWIFRGYLPAVFNAAYEHGVNDVDGLMSSQCGDGFESVSYVMLTMLWQAFGAVLAWGAIAWGFLQWVIRDILLGVSELAADVKRKWQADEEITQAVVTEHVKAVAAPNVPFGELPVEEKIRKVAEDSREKDEALNRRFDELEKLIKTTAKPAARRRTTAKTPAKSEGAK